MKDNHYVRLASVDVDTGSYWYEKIVEALKDKGFVIAENPFSPNFDVLVEDNEYRTGGKKDDTK